MQEEKEKKEVAEKGECVMYNQDADDPNLCCCYVIDSDGSYEDPCFHPVADCCC